MIVPWHGMASWPSARNPARWRSLRGAVGWLLALGIAPSLGSFAAAQDGGWRDDWQVASGFSINLDVGGLSLPSCIAFVPDPGPRPSDPLYFVTELRGKIKVVTNDRTVHVFAKDFFELEVEEELPGMQGEAGLTGLCLAPEQGYVFVTFNYQDSRGLLRNCIVRFESDPGTFSLEPRGITSFADIFADHPSAVSHMIGPLVARDGALFVGVGDAESPFLSRSLESPNGKILRMSLDGDPLPDNPFYVDEDRKKPRNYVWALGLRNPFGLAFAGDQLCASDNGPGVDRFVTVEKGRNYRYDGTNWSIGTNADVVFGPAVGPVHMDYVPPDSEVFPPEYRARFYLAFAGFVQQKPGPGERGERSVVAVPYDPSGCRVNGVPKPFLEYVGPNRQMPCGVAMGPDGLYMTPLFRVDDRGSAVMRITYDPANAHRRVIGDSPVSLMAASGCIACHTLDSTEPLRVGPTLDRDVLAARLMERLHSTAYLETLDSVDEIDAEPFISYRDARQRIRDLEGMAKVRQWITYQILEPRFDNPASQMPNLGLTEKQATRIADGLLGRRKKNTDVDLLDRVRLFFARHFPRPRQRHLFGFFGVGVLVGALAASAAWLLLRLRSRRRASEAS